VEDQISHKPAQTHTPMKCAALQLHRFHWAGSQESGKLPVGKQKLVREAINKCLCWSVCVCGKINFFLCLLCGSVPKALSFLTSDSLSVIFPANWLEFQPANTISPILLDGIDQNCRKDIIK
jgi:hypothetical protein